MPLVPARMRASRLRRTPAASAVPARQDEQAHVCGRQAARPSFNTETKIGTLAMFAKQASHGQPRVRVRLFPRAVHGRLTLIDSMDDVPTFLLTFHFRNETASPMFQRCASNALTPCTTGARGQWHGYRKEGLARRARVPIDVADWSRASSKTIVD